MLETKCPNCKENLKPEQTEENMCWFCGANLPNYSTMRKNPFQSSAVVTFDPRKLPSKLVPPNKTTKIIPEKRNDKFKFKNFDVRNFEVSFQKLFGLGTIKGWLPAEYFVYFQFVQNLQMNQCFANGNLYINEQKLNSALAELVGVVTGKYITHRKINLLIDAYTKRKTRLFLNRCSIFLLFQIKLSHSLNIKLKLDDAQLLIPWYGLFGGTQNNSKTISIYLNKDVNQIILDHNQILSFLSNEEGKQLMRESFDFTTLNI